MNSFKILCVSFFLLQGCVTTISMEEDDFLYPTDINNIISLIPKDYQYENLAININDDTVLKGISITKENTEASIIYFGGNQFSIASSGGKVISALLNLNVNIFIFDHRGYGQSKGKPTIKNLSSDSIVVYDYVNELTSNKVVVYGQSLGSFLAANVDKHRDIDGLVLESSATTVRDWIIARTPVYLSPFIEIKLDEALSSINNLSIVKESTTPLLVMVGENDNQTPHSLSDEIYNQSISNNKHYKKFSDAGHNDIPIQPDYFYAWKKYLKSL